MSFVGLPLWLAATAAMSPKSQLQHDDGSPYLTRWTLAGVNSLDEHDQTKPFSTYLHEIHTPDGDRHSHNHPWRWAASLILTGGYTEERLESGLAVTYTHQVGDLSGLMPGDYHRIVAVEPGTFTLFIVGRETHDWGFLVDDHHVPHRDYFASGATQPMTLVRIR